MERTLAGVEEVKRTQKQQTHMLQTLLHAQKHSDIGSSVELPEGLTLPITDENSLRNVEQIIIDPQVQKILVLFYTLDNLNLHLTSNLRQSVYDKCRMNAVRIFGA